MSIRVGVVGASGAVGQELLAALAEAAREERLDLEPPTLLATGRLEGESYVWLDGDDDTLPLERFSDEAVRGLEYALVAVPAAAATGVVETLRRQGVVVVDASRTYRATAPLFFAAGNPSLTGSSLVALPSAEALLVTRVVAALAALQPVAVRATVLRPASAAGVVGVNELAEGTAKLLNGQEPEGAVLPHRLPFNLVPQAGPLSDGDSEAESDLAAELGRLTGLPGLKVASTVAFAPWFYGTVATLSLSFGQPVSVDEARALLATADGVKLLDTPGESIYPMPSLATGDEAALVGRLRTDPIDGGLQLVAVLDAVRATAVQAVAALESLVRRRAGH